MPERTIHTTMVCLLAVLLTVGFTAAPVAAIDVSAGDDGVTVEDDEVSVDADDWGVTVEEEGVEVRTGDDPDETAEDALDDDGGDAQVPEEVCTDVGDEFHSSVPWNDLPWLDDLPEEAQPPNLPADLVHPRLVSSIVVGVTPNQCDVQDPNDPSYDPTQDGVDPTVDHGAGQGEYKDGAWMLLLLDGKAYSASDAPGVSGMIWTTASSEDGYVAPDVAINDGEKDYAVNPRFGYDSDGTGFASAHAGALNKRGGATVTCDGEACHLDTTGTPAVPAPAVPAPTGQDDDDGGDGDDGSQAQFPEEVCTDVGEEFHSSVPWNDLPWLDDLPEEAQPPNLPADLVHPRLASSIVVGVTPNQCEVQDPNDPSYHPTEDGVDPDASATPGQGDYKDGSWGILLYDATLNRGGDGPGVSGIVWTTLSSEDGYVDPAVAINDGEKDYAVNPHLGFDDAGTGEVWAEGRALNRRGGAGATCDGEECHLDTAGTPAVPAPAVPAPTGQDDDGDGGDGDDGSQTQVPEEVCTNVGKEVAGEVPWHDIPWLNDLPEEAQPEDVPTQLVGPWTIGNILSSGSVTQCDVQDPNDPSYDPTEDGVDPDASATPGQGDYKDGAWGILVYEVTLDDGGSGPGVSGIVWTLGSSEDGTVDTAVAINDGEKDYVVDPRVDYWSEGSAYVTTDVYALDYRAGVEVVCDEDGCDGGPT